MAEEKDINTNVSLTEEQKKYIEQEINLANKRMRVKKVRLPERIEEISMRWLKAAPFYSEFLLRFNYFYTESIPTMGVNSQKGKINLYINPKFLDGGSELIKYNWVDKDGKILSQDEDGYPLDEKSKRIENPNEKEIKAEPIILKNDKGEPILDPLGNATYETELSKPLADDELQAVLVHEIMHLVRYHHERALDDHKVWNIAGDMLINEDIQGSMIGKTKLRLPKGGIFLSTARKEGYDGEEVTEPLYYFLLDVKQQLQDYVQDLMQKNGSNSSGNQTCETCGGTGKVDKSDQGEGDKEEDSQGKGDGEDSGDGDKQESGSGQGGEETCPDCGGSGQKPQQGQGKGELFDIIYGSGLDDHDIMDASDELAEDTIKDVINTGKIRGWGNISGNLQSKLETLTRPSKIPWEKLLKRYLTSCVYDHGPYVENSWSRRNRRGYPLPGIKKLNNEVIVAVDTSGSISDHDLEVFFSEIEHIVKDKEQIKVLQWDTRVQETTMNYQSGDWKRVTLYGRGGTDVQCVFDWMRENNMQKFPVVIFTDGWFNYNFDNSGIQTLWALTRGGEEVPNGKNIYIEIED